MIEGGIKQESLIIEVPGVNLEGILSVPEKNHGLIIFAHDSGSSRLSPRNSYVAQVLRAAGLGTLLFDLLTSQEDADQANRFNIDLLTSRLVAATNQMIKLAESSNKHYRIGYFGASTGAAAAIKAATRPELEIGAVVSRGGRPDLAGDDLKQLESPTLLIVGGEDEEVITINKQAYGQIRSVRELSIVPGATHLFSEPGALEEVADLAREWFVHFL